MPRLPIKFACGLYDRVLRLYTGEVQPDGIDLEFVVMDEPREIFDRMAGASEFDACEMSASEFISHMGTGHSPFVAIPVFVSRVFRHGFICINRKSGIKRPKDLEGRRVGVPLYTMSAALWIRGLLQHEYGVDLSKIRWVQGSFDAPGKYGNPSPPPLLKPVAIEHNQSGKSLSQCLADGDIDATIGSRTVSGLGQNPDIQRLIPDFREVEQAYYRKTKVFPIMHLVILRRDVYERHPFIAGSLYDAFCRSKDGALRRMRQLGALSYMLPWMTAEIDELNEVFGDDPWPYGVEPNRPTLEALVDYMVEQSFIPQRVPIEELFVRDARWSRAASP